MRYDLTIQHSRVKRINDTGTRCEIVGYVVWPQPSPARDFYKNREANKKLYFMGVLVAARAE